MMFELAQHKYNKARKDADRTLALEAEAAIQITLSLLDVQVDSVDVDGATWHVNGPEIEATCEFEEEPSFVSLTSIMCFPNDYRHPLITDPDKRILSDLADFLEFLLDKGIWINVDTVDAD